MSNLVRWDPSGRLMSWPDIVRRMFESNLARPSLLEPFGPDLALDMYETEDSVVVKVAVPGVKPEACWKEGKRRINLYIVGAP